MNPSAQLSCTIAICKAKQTSAARIPGATIAQPIALGEGISNTAARYGLMLKVRTVVILPT